MQLSLLVGAHHAIISEVKVMARRATLLGEDRTNDLLVAKVLRANQLQMWLKSEHRLEMLLAHATQWAEGHAARH
jgi:hypothetical protein